jgi:leucyl-tRNA synthetase
MVWKVLGKEGLAVKAPWPVAGEEDKILTRQAKFLRDSLKSFRAVAGKTKKAWSKASILVSDTYPQWKINVLLWMQEQFNAENGFPETFMKDVKDWSGKNVEDKKLMKFTMQFASFSKNEAEEVGAVALDVELPFDQKEILGAVVESIKKQTNISELDIIKLGTDEASEVPDKAADSAAPGKPSLWLR